MPSFNFGNDQSKHPKLTKISPNASFQSSLQIFPQDGGSQMFLQKSGSIDGKFNQFIGNPGSFNPPSKFPPDNQK